MLESLSFQMAMILRHEAKRSGICDDEGWVGGDSLLQELSTGKGRRYNMGKGHQDLKDVKLTDLEEVVRKSFKNGIPRFEMVNWQQQPWFRAYRGEQKPVGGRGQGYAQAPRVAPSDTAPQAAPSRPKQDWTPSGGKGGKPGQAAQGEDPWHGPCAADPWAPTRSSSSSLPQGGKGSAPRGSWQPDAKAGPAPANTGAKSQTTTPFEGPWAKGPDWDTPICAIKGDTLTWAAGSKTEVKIMVMGTDLVIPGEEGLVRGKLMDDDSSWKHIAWEDCDMWSRPGCPPPSSPTEDKPPEAPAVFSSSSARRSSGGAPPTSTTSPAAREPSAAAPAAVRPPPPEPAPSTQEDPKTPRWQPGLGTAVAYKANEAFDGSGYGTEYLSLVKGEKLFVQPEQQDGWLFALSCHTGRTGWIPPSYVEAVVEQAPKTRPKPPPPPPPSGLGPKGPPGLEV